ncbi:MAG: sortase [Patescibacteria group bacterium]|nr:sortase [Patescibacteria group bacterium]
MKNATKLPKKYLIRHHINKITSSEYFRILILRTIGNFLLLSSIFMILKTIYPVLREEFKYAFNKIIKKEYRVIEKNTQPKLKQKGLLSKTFKFKDIEILVPSDPNFSIMIPKIGANSRILPNVDPSNENIYLDALNKGVAHAEGTAFPGEGGHIFLFAHSTDYFWNVSVYNAIFYLLYKLEKDDEVNIFYKGQRYVYKVIGKEVVDPSQVQYLTRKTNREFLTLQTCWPPGTTLKRLLVFAVRVSE